MIFVEDGQFQTVQFQEQFTHQGRGLQGVSGSFFSQHCRSNHTQALERQLVHRILREVVPGLRFLQQNQE